MPEKSIILFDGVCNLCNNAVNFVINHDKKINFLFASLQSPFGEKFLTDHNINGEINNSFILLQGEKIFNRSTAALRVAKKLDGLWPLLYALIIVPRMIRDSIYTFVANNRYKWFGKRDSCMIPTPELKARFLN